MPGDDDAANRRSCTCGAPIEVATMICQRGHFQPWLRVNQVIFGVGPDAPTEVNERGAAQSKSEYAITSIDPRALLELARVHAQGDAKYGRDNWRGIDERDHINHALIHLFAYLAGDTQDDHLAHALCRTEMALAIKLQGGPK